MATKLYEKGVTRESCFTYQGRPIIIRLEQGGKIVRLRQKGRRTWHTTTVEGVFWLAVRATMRELERIKEQAKKARRLERKGRKK
jgi:hypothetical protein